MRNILKYLPNGVINTLKVLLEEKYEAYVVGGAVRDALMNKKIHDFDITTNALPDEVKDIYLKKGYKVIETGIKHGTVTVIKDSVAFEITTFRIDGKYEDGRHPDSVCFTSNLKKDLELSILVKMVTLLSIMEQIMKNLVIILILLIN